MQISWKNQISQTSVIMIRRSGLSQIISDVLGELEERTPAGDFDSFIIYK